MHRSTPTRLLEIHDLGECHLVHEEQGGAVCRFGDCAFQVGAIFGAELERRGARRCRSYWFCGLGGLVLGLVTGLLGRSAISATTVAVESVVLRHLEQQLIDLLGIDEPAVLAISAIVMEERLHHDQAAGHVAENSLWSRLLNPVVSSATEAVIWLGMRA